MNLKDYKNLSRKYTDLFKSYESKCEEIKNLQLKFQLNSLEFKDKQKDGKNKKNESYIDSNENLIKSHFDNINPGASASNLNMSSLKISSTNQNNMNTNESIIITNSNKNQNNLRTHFSNNNINNSLAKKIIDEKPDKSFDMNKKLDLVQPQIKNTLNFSQLKMDTENSIIHLNNNNRDNSIVNNTKENNFNENKSILVKFKVPEADSVRTEDLIEQKNAKIMLKSKSL